MFSGVPLDRLRQPNVLSVSASWRCYLGNLGSWGAIAMKYDRAIRRLPCRLGKAMTVFCVLASVLAWPILPAFADQLSETLDRPKIGLVLADGGAGPGASFP